jgi:hypothetical protein|tara:strand:- start:119 stop:988 length:870 start_codon:yes stop_codon:yes gene_type:complete
MKVDELHREFNVLSQTSDSLKKASFEKYEIDEYLNKACVQFVKDNYSFSMTTRKGFEVDQSRISKLSSLVIKSPQLQSALIPVDLGNGIYELNLDDLGRNLTGNNDYFRYMYYIDGYANCSLVCGNKTTTQRIKLYISRHDSGDSFYNGSSWYWKKVKASFGKARTIAFSSLDVESNNNDQLSDININGKYSNDSLSSIFIDTKADDVSAFNVSSIEISYIKYPNKIFSGGYQHIDGRNINLNTQVECDIDDIFHQEIVRYAVSLAANDVTNIANIQIRSTQIQNDLVN